jgi:CHAT domain-containing protein/tetratricopeptide (TPR) repeat protein
VAGGAAVRAQEPAASRSATCPEAERIDRLLSQSAQAFAARDSVRGMALLREAFGLTETAGCEVQHAEALLRLGIGDVYELRLGDAVVKFRAAAATFQRYDQAARESEALIQLGNALINDGKHADAVPPLLRARELAQKRGDVRMQLRLLPNLAYSLGEGPEKERFRSEGLAFARATPGGRFAECPILHEWGDQLFSDDRFSDAFPKLLDAVRCFEDVGDASQIGRAYVSLGRVYRAHGRLAEALEQYARAVAMQQNDSDRLAEVQSINAIGVTLGFMGRDIEGLERLQEALGIARRVRSERTVLFLLANIASLHLDQGRYAQAAAALEEILASPGIPYEALRLAELSRAYLGLKRPQQALDVAERAVVSARSESEQVAALHVRVEALVALKQFDRASSDLRRAVDAVETLRANTVADDFLKRGFSQRFQYLFSASIALLEDQGRSREAIETAERARARALLDLLASRGTAASSGSARAGASAAVFDDIVATAARERSTVVAYWVGQAETFVWVIQGDGRVGAARIPVTAAALATMISEATGSGSASQAQAAAMMLGAGGAARPWRALYRTLVEPIRRHLPTRPGSRLTIVPHGPLFGLPFAALRDGSGLYLIESFELHYVPAIGALQASPPSPKGALSALLVGDPGSEAVRDRMLPLPPLPWADREVVAIQRLLPKRATVLRGRDATEAGVRQQIEGRTLLHFATHGIVRNEEHLSSYLALRPSDAATADGAADGRLTASETYGLHLKADLIVLSGCRTALGPIMGDGVIGFTRAFLAAGAESVVATTWDVADQTSYEVMRHFYAAWVGGADKSRALRQAQLSVLRALRAGTIRVNGVALPESPRLWAGYVLVGRP